MLQRKREGRAEAGSLQLGGIFNILFFFQICHDYVCVHVFMVG